MNIKKLLAAGLVSIPLVVGMSSCDKSEDRNKYNYTRTEHIQQEDRLRNTVLSYLSQPKFSNSDFMEQITGTKAELQMLDLKEGMIYLSIPTRHYSREVIAELTDNPAVVEFGKSSNGQFKGDRVLLGNYVLRKPGNYFFRFPLDDFRVDPSDLINIPYRSADYSINMQELQGFLENSSIYGGHLSADTGTDKYGRHKIIANHGAFVARKGESSLERLVNELTKNENLPEKISQRLLDFVTEEIDYNFQDASSNVEVLKRPNEVLMTRGSDCSGKVILYASLLEQTSIDYLLVYTDGHITVAVEGDYENRNGLSFNFGDDTYYIAETTARGFQIGRSRLDREISIKDIKYIQRPGKYSRIYDAHTGNPLPFLR